MSAELLREAASLMRERAEVLSWDDGWYAPREMEATIALGEGFASPLQAADAEHIASWHPTVALAVADLLDELLRSLSVFGEPADDDPLWRKPTASAALAVARNFLGRDA